MNLFYEYNDEVYDKNALSKKLDEDLLKYNIDKKDIIIYIYKYLYDIYNEEIIKQKYFKNSYKKQYISFLIDIYSPFFDILSKKQIFEEVGIIPIKISLIEKYNLRNDYISKFNYLNKNNYKYSSLLFEYKDINDINYLTKFNINFNGIKNLIIIEKKEIGSIENNNYFFKTLFSFKNIENNLVSLYIQIDPNFYHYNKIKGESFNNLNNFKSLKILNLNELKFDTIFIIKLINLIELFLNNCENIAIGWRKHMFKYKNINN